MYILYVLLLVNLGQEADEDIGGSFATIDECWVQATKVAKSPDVFSVRCALAPEPE